MLFKIPNNYKCFALWFLHVMKQTKNCNIVRLLKPFFSRFTNVSLKFLNRLLICMVWGRRSKQELHWTGVFPTIPLISTKESREESFL